MTTNTGLDGRVAGRGVVGKVMVARREREGGDLGRFVVAILIIAAFFLLGYNERLPSGAGSDRSSMDIDLPLAGALLRPGSPPG